MIQTSKRKPVRPRRKSLILTALAQRDTRACTKPCSHESVRIGHISSRGGGNSVPNDSIHRAFSRAGDWALRLSVYRFQPVRIALQPIAVAAYRVGIKSGGGSSRTRASARAEGGCGVCAARGDDVWTTAGGMVDRKPARLSDGAWPWWCDVCLVPESDLRPDRKHA